MTYKDPDHGLMRRRQLYHAKMGQPAAPPPGYISLKEAARRLHYSHVGIWKCAKRGDFGPVWTRGPRSAIYVREEALHGR